MKWLQFVKPVRSMDAKAARAYISEHPAEAVTILDVRQPAEYEKSHIPGAVLIPLPKMTEEWKTLDPEKTTLVY